MSIERGFDGFHKRDGVCNPVPNVFVALELSGYIDSRKMFRTGQHAPSGLRFF
ncbi:hypothetical protein B0F88_105211 [Methylobacter tundripaludum]|uniref:Uncharacterized protein n=1 Tax=Methylobacter tundripaludum TaxID=173365 RepID=A0A2S6H3M8_9GAMM|nr:hypothetical protein B0F88_105211 [Methylobacter tundripaludum]